MGFLPAYNVKFNNNGSLYLEQDGYVDDIPEMTQEEIEQAYKSEDSSLDYQIEDIGVSHE